MFSFVVVVFRFSFVEFSLLWNFNLYVKRKTLADFHFIHKCLKRLQFVDFLQDVTLSFLYTFIFSINCDFVHNMCARNLHYTTHNHAWQTNK